MLLDVCLRSAALGRPAFQAQIADHLHKCCWQEPHLHKQKEEEIMKLRVTSKERGWHGGAAVSAVISHL